MNATQQVDTLTRLGQLVVDRLAADHVSEDTAWAVGGTTPIQPVGYATGAQTVEHDLQDLGLDPDRLSEADLSALTDMVEQAYQARLDPPF